MGLGTEVNQRVTFWKKRFVRPKGKITEPKPPRKVEIQERKERDI
jgi:hypothetical protein